jgi:hypothetical protein
MKGIGRARGARLAAEAARFVANSVISGKNGSYALEITML